MQTYNGDSTDASILWYLFLSVGKSPYFPSMSPKKKIESPQLAQAQAMIQELRAAKVTWQDIASASGMSVNGVRAIEKGERKSPTSETIDGLTDAVRMLKLGQLGPAKTPQQIEGDMVEMYDRDAADAGLPQWEQLTERERDRIRAEWSEVVARQKRLAAQVEDEFRKWVVGYVREDRSAI
jgi:transcriptional regulator with XRE-family HTH domain